MMMRERERAADRFVLVMLAAAFTHDDADNDLTSLDRVIGGVERTRYGVPHIPS